MPIPLMLVLTFGAPALKDRPPALVGTWEVRVVVLGGQEAPALAAGTRYVFTAAGQWEVYDRGERVGARAYTVNPRTLPQAIDIGPRPGWTTGATAGIYKVDESTMTICLAAPGGDRPREFVSPERSQTVLIVCKRLRSAD